MELIDKYREAAIIHGESSVSGDHRKANQAHDKLTKLLGLISQAKIDAELFSLYNDQDTWVQLWSASHTLEIDEASAVKKLQSISESSVPVVSMTARYTLMEWNQGALRFR